MDTGGHLATSTTPPRMVAAVARVSSSCATAEDYLVAAKDGRRRTVSLLPGVCQLATSPTSPTGGNHARLSSHFTAVASTITLYAPQLIVPDPEVESATSTGTPA